MGVIFYIINLILSLFDLMLLARAICSWIPSSRDSIIYRISYTITEPILSPVRDLVMKMEWARRCPIDISFFVVVILVNLLSGVVSYLASVL